MREFAATAKDFKDWAFFARERFADEKFARALLKDRTQFADEGESFSGWEFLFSLVQRRDSSVFDFLVRRAFSSLTNRRLSSSRLTGFYDNLEPLSRKSPMSAKSG